jgi:hypothetical protein
MAVFSYLIQIHQDGGLGALVLEQFLGQLVKALHLELGLLDYPLESAQLAGRGTLVEEVNVDVLGDRVLAGGDSLEQRTLATAVLAEQAIATAQSKFESGICDQHPAVEHQAHAGHLHILAGWRRRQHASGDTVRETMLVHLVGQTLDLVHLVGRSGRLIGLDRFSKGVELRLVAIYRCGGASILGVGLGPRGDRLLAPLSGTLGQALFLGRGRRHGGWVSIEERGEKKMEENLMQRPETGSCTIQGSRLCPRPSVMEEAKAAAPLVGWYQNMEGGGGRFWWGSIFLKTLITDSGLIVSGTTAAARFPTKFEAKDTLVSQECIECTAAQSFC